jgi:hypothetical protein
MKKYLFLLLFAAIFSNVEAQSITTNPTSFPISTSLNSSRYYTVKEVQNAVSATKNSEIGLFSNFFIPDGSLKSTLPKIASLDTLKMAGIFGASDVEKEYVVEVSFNGAAQPTIARVIKNTLLPSYTPSIIRFTNGAYGFANGPINYKYIVCQKMTGYGGNYYDIYASVINGAASFSSSSIPATNAGVDIIGRVLFILKQL